MTKLRNEIYVLFRIKSNSRFTYRIHIFDDRHPFNLQNKVETKETEDPADIASSEKEQCLYVSYPSGKCVWKITRDSNNQHNIIKWLTTDYAPFNLTVSKYDQSLVILSSSALMIYGSNAELIRSIQLPKEIAHHRHAVETSFGNIIIIHKWTDEKEVESQLNILQRERRWIVSELTSDGQVVIRRFIPLNETQKLNFPTYFELDSDERVFVSDDLNRRVILLDSDLEWIHIICPTHEKNEDLLLSP